MFSVLYHLQTLFPGFVHREKFILRPEHDFLWRNGRGEGGGRGREMSAGMVTFSTNSPIFHHFFE